MTRELTLRATVVTVACALALAAVGCRGQTGDRAVATPPALRSFDEIITSFHESSYAILYRFEDGGLTGELLWRKSGSLERWDHFVETRGVVFLEAAVDEDGEPVRSCKWRVDDGRITDSACGSTSSYVEGLVTPLLILGLQPTSAETILGQPVSCYGAAGRAGDNASVCFTERGHPLDLSAKFGVWGPAHLEAVGYWEGDDLSALHEIPDGLPLGTAITSTDLPRLPALNAYLEDIESGTE